VAPGADLLVRSRPLGWLFGREAIRFCTGAAGRGVPRGPGGGPTTCANQLAARGLWCTVTERGESGKLVPSPVFAPPDGIQAGFNGDYSGLVINQDEEAHPIWSDTRNSDPFAPANGVVHDEDVFTAKANLPEGVAKPSVGQVGKQ
jgi:hypothetical protein